MIRFLIIEGPDSSGKTTLAKFLAERTQSLYWHSSGHPLLHSIMPIYHIKMLESIEDNLKMGRSVVHDRSWPSEFIYGRELRPQLVDSFPFKEFQDRINKFGGRYIFCMDDDVTKRFRNGHDSKDHQYDEATFMNIVMAYRVLMEHMLTRPDSRHYDMLKHGQDMRCVLKWL